MHVKELFDLTNQTAIVTGGGTGIGKQIAIAFAEAQPIPFFLFDIRSSPISFT